MKIIIAYVSKTFHGIIDYKNGIETISSICS